MAQLMLLLHYLLCIFELQISSHPHLSIGWIADDNSALMCISQVLNLLWNSWECSILRAMICYPAIQCHSEEDGFTFESGSSHVISGSISLPLFFKDVSTNLRTWISEKLLCRNEMELNGVELHFTNLTMSVCFLETYSRLFWEPQSSCNIHDAIVSEAI